MKKIFFISLFALHLGISRFSAQVSLTTSADVINYLNGSWTWFRSCGGLAPGCTYPTDVGYTRAIKFTKITGLNDSILYSTYKNGGLEHSGKAKVGIHSYQGQNMGYLDSIKGVSSFTYSFTVFQPKQDTVTFNDGSMTFDGTIPTYYRISVITGLKDEQSGEISLSVNPVPATEKIHLETGNLENIRGISFYDLTGKRITLKPLQDKEYAISELSPGLYFVKITTASGRSASCKFVVLAK